MAFQKKSVGAAGADYGLGRGWGVGGPGIPNRKSESRRQPHIYITSPPQNPQALGSQK